MPTTKSMSSLAGLIDSDLEDDILHDSIEMPSPDSNQENVEKTARIVAPAASKGVSKPKASAAKLRKVKPASRRLSGGAGVTKAKSATTTKPRGRRAPLKEQANQEHNSDTEEVDEFQAAEAPVLKDKTNVPAQEKTVADKPKKQPAKRGRKPTAEKPQLEMASAAATKNTSKATPAVQVDGEFEYTPTTSKTLKAKPKPKRGAGRPTARNKETTTEPETLHEEIPETQADPMDLDPTTTTNQAAEDEDEFPTSVYKRVNHARSYSKTRQPSVARIRANSNTSDSERTSNADLRRKLGETTKKLESLELKYRNLRDVGIKEAEANFEKLRKTSEHRAKTADSLIASLRASLSTQTTTANEVPALKAQISTLTTQLQTSASQTAQLNTLLNNLQTENQTLMAKLTASRTAASAPPSSAVKPRQTPGVNRGNAASGGNGLTAAAAAEAATLASMKEDLYSDFTGLIIRNIERHRNPDEDAVDVYDCLQTGRNGTLHFHLAVPALDAAQTTGGGANGQGKPRMSTFEEQEFTYTPKLDEGRDKALIELLPEYMQEEITFSRGNAGRFYARVVGVLMRRVEDEEE